MTAIISTRSTATAGVIRYAGDDWEIPVTYKDSNNVPVPLTGYTPIVLVTNTLDDSETLIDDPTEAVLLDQSIPANYGSMIINVSRDITKNFVNTVDESNNLLPVSLRLMLINSEGKRTTLGTFIVNVKRG
jgi:hypothetical protein